MSHSVVGAVIAVIGLLAGTAGYYAGAASRPVARRDIDRERNAIVALVVAVVLLVAAGIAVAMHG